MRLNTLKTYVISQPIDPEGCNVTITVEPPGVMGFVKFNNITNTFSFSPTQSFQVNTYDVSLKVMDPWNQTFEPTF